MLLRGGEVVLQLGSGAVAIPRVQQCHEGPVPRDNQYGSRKAPTASPRRRHVQQQLPPHRFPATVVGAPGHRRQPDRHLAGVVRLLHLRHRRRTGLQQAVLPELRAAGRHPAGLRDVRRGFRRPPARRRGVRPLRRQARPQERPGGDPAADGHGDVRDRPPADLRHDRRLGTGPAGGAALPAGARPRRRVGRRRPDDAGVRRRPSDAGSTRAGRRSAYRSGCCSPTASCR